MLRAPLSLILIVGFALAGTEIQRRLRAGGIRLPAVEGVFWILLGFSLGGRVLGVFQRDILTTLHPVVLLALAWIGLVFGMQLEFRVIRRLEVWHRVLGLFFPLAIGAVVSLVCLELSHQLLIALGLGAVAMLAAPESLEALSRSRRPRYRTAVRFLRLITAFSGIPAVVLFGVASIIYCPVSSLSGGDLSPGLLLLAVGGIGLVSGYALLVMVRGLSDVLSNVTILLGITALVAGATSILGISPLPAAALTGAIVINRCIFPNRVLQAAHLFERPLLIALLVLVGASAKALAFSWWVFLVFLLLRPAALLVAGWVLSKILRRRGLSSELPTLGLGLLPQGALGLGVLIALMSISHPGPGFLEGVALAMILSQLVGDLWLRRFLFEAKRGGGE